MDDYATLPLTTLETDRQKAREWFTERYYGRVSQVRNCRHVFFCFGRSLSIVVTRLLELTGSFNNVHLVAMPFDDEASMSLKSFRTAKKEDLPENATKESYAATAFIRMYNQYAQYITAVPRPPIARLALAI
jgi:hypothetical protein